LRALAKKVVEALGGKHQRIGRSWWRAAVQFCNKSLSHGERWVDFREPVTV
jgi:hypothetical protein